MGPAPLIVGLTGVLLAGGSPAQEVVRAMYTPFFTGEEFGYVRSMGDLDGDGYRDLISGFGIRVPVGQGYGYVWDGTVCASGANRSVLWAVNSPQLRVYGVACRDIGDMDGDRVRDFGVLVHHWLGRDPARVYAVSAATGAPLWSVAGPTWNDSYDDFIGDLDTDGDGLGDLVAFTYHGPNIRIDVFDHWGTLRYTLPFSIWAIPVSLARVGDVDQDGADDFVYGRSGPTAHGFAVLVSGRTGATLRTVQGQFGDYLGLAVAEVGDMDGDGIPDFVASGQYAYLGVFSGATGAVIHEWRGPEVGGFDTFARDVDLDGVVDLVTSGPFSVIGPNSTGRLRAYSGRDGQLLWELQADPGLGTTNELGKFMADLGALPGSPYPVFVATELGYFGTAGTGRHLWIRTNLPGAGLQHGLGCNSAGPVPKIGLRRAGNGLRLTVAEAQSGGLAWLVMGTSRTTYLGAALPLSLDPFGLTGCSLLVAPEIVGVRTLGSSGLDAGYAAVDFPGVPTAGNGRDIFAQWITLGSGPAGPVFATTAAQQFRLGP